MPTRFFDRSKVRRLMDVLFTPLAFTGALFFRYFRRNNGYKMPLTKKILLNRGVFPIADHYDDPLFNTKKHLNQSLRKDRALPGIDFNIDEQLSILRSFHYNTELLSIPLEKGAPGAFYYHNGVFESGDAEYLYNMIRHFKPQRFIEIGGGYSSLIAQQAIKMNALETPGYTCQHTCIEPYENPWLENIGIELIRKKAESIDISFYLQLAANDILFIDSSHIIRPQGEVLFIYNELLPQLNKGVLIHVHDIFTPRDYPDSWVIDQTRFWNEQYLLEAFLSNNKELRIIGSLNYLVHHYRSQLAEKCPVLAIEADREPGSFWMIKN